MPDEETKSMKARENVQEWSKARLLQIQDLLNWELEKLTQDLVLAHEQFLGLPPSSSMRGPISRQWSAPKISQTIEETLEPSFGEASTTGEAAETSELPKTTRNSWRKMTPFLRPSDLADLQVSEGDSDTEPSSPSMGAVGRLSKGSLHSNGTEGMERLSTGGNSNLDGQSPPPELLEVITDNPGAEKSTTPSTWLVAKEEETTLESPTRTISPQIKRMNSEMTRSRRSGQPPTRLAKLVRSQVFDISFSILIMVNCVTMGMQADSLVNVYSEDVELVTNILENILVFLFTFEIAARLKVFGCGDYFNLRTSEGWFNFFDAIIVLVSGPIFGWVFPLVELLSGEEFSAGFLRTLSVFRALRLLRIVRVIQRMPMFREVWLLLRGLTSSLRTLLWTVIVIFVLTYLFAILGCWIISAEIQQIILTEDMSSEEAENITSTFHYVKGVVPLMQLLIQFLTLDSWNSKMEQITRYAPWCVAYFYTYIAVAVFVLMNLVTAIIVENAMSASKMDENEKLKQMEDFKKRELKELEHLFYLMDADGDGTLDWEEFQDAFMDEEMSRKWRLLDFGPDECKELFDLLDDGDGGIHTGEFFHGLARMKGGAQSRDLMRVGQQVDRIGKDVQSLIQAYRTNVRTGSFDCPSAFSEGSRARSATATGFADSASETSDPFAKARKPKSPKLAIEEAKKLLAGSKSKSTKPHSVSPASREATSPSLSASGYAGFSSHDGSDASSAAKVW